MHKEYYKYNYIAISMSMYILLLLIFSYLCCLTGGLNTLSVKPHSGSCSVLLDRWAEHTVRKPHSG